MNKTIKSSSSVANETDLRSVEWDADTKYIEAKRNNYGIPSAGTADYRNGDMVRPKVVLKKTAKGTVDEVLKKKVSSETEASRSLAYW